jgi:hypothetical protein
MAIRDYAESYNESNKVRFTLLHLRLTKDGYIPPSFWEEEGAYVSKGVYADVGEAFLLELGLPNPDEETYGGLIKTGGRPRSE